VNTERRAGVSSDLTALPTRIGWQGLRLDAPADWYLKGYSGDWQEGFLQVGSPHSMELDLKWSRTRP
jgi:hypothetical protein